MTLPGREVMDEKALRDKLMAKAALAVDELIVAIKKAPRNNIIGGSEWQVHDVGKELAQQLGHEWLGFELDADHCRHANRVTAGAGAENLFSGTAS